MAYETPQTRAILQQMLGSIHRIAEESKAFSSDDQMREAISQIRDLIENGYKTYLKELGRVQEEELAELRRQAAALKAQ